MARPNKYYNFLTQHPITKRVIPKPPPALTKKQLKEKKTYELLALLSIPLTITATGFLIPGLGIFPLIGGIALIGSIIAIGFLLFYLFAYATVGSMFVVLFLVTLVYEWLQFAIRGRKPEISMSAIMLFKGMKFNR